MAYRITHHQHRHRHLSLMRLLRLLCPTPMANNINKVATLALTNTSLMVVVLTRVATVLRMGVRPPMGTTLVSLRGHTLM